MAYLARISKLRLDLPLAHPVQPSELLGAETVAPCLDGRSLRCVNLDFAASSPLMAAVWDASHGILMFPILKQHGERIAFGYLGFRIVDAVFIGLWSLFLLLQIPLSREYLSAGASAASSLEALSAVSIQPSPTAPA